MHRGFVLAAAGPGLSPGLGPFAVCHSPSLSVTSSVVLSKSQKAPNFFSPSKSENFSLKTKN